MIYLRLGARRQMEAWKLRVLGEYLIAKFPIGFSAVGTMDNEFGMVDIDFVKGILNGLRNTDLITIFSQSRAKATACLRFVIQENNSCFHCPEAFLGSSVSPDSKTLKASL